MPFELSSKMADTVEVKHVVGALHDESSRRPNRSTTAPGRGGVPGDDSGRCGSRTLLAARRANAPCTVHRRAKSRFAGGPRQWPLADSGSWKAGRVLPAGGPDRRLLDTQKSSCRL